MSQAGSFVNVFAVEDTSVQLVWVGLPAPQMVVGVGDRTVEVEAAPPAVRRFGIRGDRPIGPWPAGPGAVTVDGLDPATTYPVWIKEPGRARQTAGQVTTLAPPPGELLCRFATISDLHIGEKHFGFRGTIHDAAPSDRDPYPVRCARAALVEAAAWGATTMVVKGDVTDRSRPEQVATAARLFAMSDLEVLVQMGNHDVSISKRRGYFAPELAAAFAAAGRAWDPACLSQEGQLAIADRPGVRLILADSPVPKHRDGLLGQGQIDAIVAAAGSAGSSGVVVTLHHPPMRYPLPLSYPPGLRRGDSRRLLDGLRAANPATVVLAGHSHRNRTDEIGGVRVVEVGSTKDYPGGWAGYAVHEGGIRQVVRRTAQPDVIAWTEATKAAVGGIWGRWSPGRLSDRCWSYPWPSAGGT